MINSPRTLAAAGLAVLSVFAVGCAMDDDMNGTASTRGSSTSTAMTDTGSSSMSTPSTTGSTAAGSSMSGSADANAQTSTVVDLAVADSRFTTLASALQSAGLVETLRGAGPFTVFAPTNDAFAKLPAGTLEDLLKPENKAKLASILTYHVVSGKVLAADAVKLDKATTVNGADADINVAGSTVTIDGSKITATDVAASNGVIHVIDTVMLPE